MNDSTNWKVPKWPFITFGIALLAVAAALAIRPAHAITETEIILATASVALGALIACVPFVLDYRAMGKLIELNSLGEVAGKIDDLKNFTAQVSTVTEQWSRVHETTQGSAEKTASAAREISDRIASEVRDFSEFQKKMNDAEKGALRLEVEKLRRSEGDWLQVLARVLDHIFALHTAASRSGQPELVAQIGNFQNACRDAARRVGLVPFGAEPGEEFNAERHRAHGVENPPADSVAAETLAPGLTFQGRLIRPALVRLQEKTSAVETEENVESAAENSTEELPLEEN